MIGRTVGNYVVKQKIGEGGMGAVYLAEHPRIHRQVAIKVLLPEYSKNSEVVARFFNEAKAANEIRNEHIIDILDFGELDDSGSYIVMEWLDGKPLTASLGGPMPSSRAVHIARGIGRALSAAHAHGIVHRDLKPDNIFLITRQDDLDFVKVLDFGIAKLMSSPTSVSADVKTKTGALIGTPSYMSPEQCRGAPVDHRTDIYALGVLLYQMLSGRLPFNAEGLGELLLQHMTQAPQPLGELVPGLSPTVEAAVMRALEKDLERRFQNVQQLLDALQGVATGAHPVLAATAPGARRVDTLTGVAGEALAPTMNRRGPRVLVWGALLGIVLAGGAVALIARKPAGPGTTGGAPRTTLGSGDLTPHPPEAKNTAPDPLNNKNPPVNNAMNLPVNNSPTGNTKNDSPVNNPKNPPVNNNVRVTISVQPASAEVLLDDAKVTLPFDGTFPRSDRPHRVVARAPGYRGEAEWVTFDGDRAIDLKLAKGHGSHERKTTTTATTTTQAAPNGTAVTTKNPTNHPDPGKPVYKGTKGTLITDYPDQ